MFLKWKKKLIKIDVNVLIQVFFTELNCNEYIYLSAYRIPTHYLSPTILRIYTNSNIFLVFLP